MVHDWNTEKLEDCVRCRWKTALCGQAIRHLALFFAPSMLDAAGVGYDVTVAGQADLVVTSTVSPRHQLLRLPHLGH
jgi:hypothetical protein